MVFVSYLQAYKGNATKLYLWLLAQPQREMTVTHARANEAMGWGKERTFIHSLHELALGHHESDDVDAPALIQILKRGRGRTATWKIRILIPRMGE